MDDTPVLQTFPLGNGPWPTVDPFLFCAHHNDRYPSGDGSLGPAASFAGRSIGSDFSGLDGWSMYHGSHVPGFPQHPHRGFETVSFVRTGYVDHADSLRAQARYGCGDVQWLTAGAGIVHAEMFPMLDEAEPNPIDFFQIWLNLPRVDKMAEPWFSMLWAETIPIVRLPGVEVTVVAGRFGGVVAPPPPPSSWASRPGSDVAIWRVSLEGGASVILPTAAPGTTRTIYVVEGTGVAVGGVGLGPRTGSILDASVERTVTVTDASVLLVLQGRPIGEPVAQYGPFVMNDRAGIEQAFRDYQSAGFGGWPFSDDAPTHGPVPARFARRPDGSLELPPGADPKVHVG